MAPPSSQLPGVITLASFFFLLLTCNQFTNPLDLTSAKLLHSFSLLYYSLTSQIFLSYHLDYCRGLNNEDYFITPHLAHRYQMSIPGAQLQMCSFSGLKSSVGLLPLLQRGHDTIYHRVGEFREENVSSPLPSDYQRAASVMSSYYH